MSGAATRSGPEPASPARPDPELIVAVGDSQTEGIGDPVGLSLAAHRGWAARLAEAWQQAAPRPPVFTNLAVAGATIGEIRATQLEPARQLAPGLALAAAGVNDVRKTTDLRQVAADYRALLAGLLGTGAQVVTIRLHDPVELLSYVRAEQRRELRSHLHDLRAAMDEVVTDLAQERLLVIDLSARPEAVDPANYTFDRLHLNARGHRAFAQAVADELADLGYRSLELPAERRRLTAEAVHAAWILRRYVPRLVASVISR